VASPVCFATLNSNEAPGVESTCMQDGQPSICCALFWVCMGKACAHAYMLVQDFCGNLPVLKAIYPSQAAMSTVALILKEIASVKRFVKSRAATTGSCDASLLQNLAGSLVRMINSTVAFGSEEAGLVNEALATDSPYSDEGTKTIMSAIDARLTANTATAAAKKKRGSSKGSSTPTQFLKHWWNYFTQSDWDFVKDNRKGLAAKFTRGIERANSIGCIHLDEQSYKWLLAMLMLVHYEELPPYKVIHEKLNELKQTGSCERKDFQFEHITEYPENPNDLPRCIYQNAYSEEQPIRVELPGVSTVADHIPLRSNSKLLKLKKRPAELEDSFQTAQHEVANMSAGDRPAVRPKKQIKEEPAHDLFGAEPHDVEEEALRLEYIQKLSQLRKTKAEPPEPKVDSLHAGAARPTTGAIIISKSSDGRLRLKPRTLELAPKDEDDEAPAARSEEPPVDDIRFEDLDEYSKAAIRSLNQRNAKAKAEKAAEKASAKAKAKLAAPAKAEDDAEEEAEEKVATVLKRPAGKRGRPPAVKAEPKKACKAESTKTATTKAEKAGSKAAKAEPIEASASNVVKLQPREPFPAGKNPPPVYYNGGVIYTSCKEKKFRALGLRGDRYTETGASWSKHGGLPAAWKFAIGAIDKYRSGGATAKKTVMKKKAMKK
jgi:hypothetical protein